MAWNRQVTADAVIQRLYESQGLFTKMNRSYDSLIKSSGATSVSRPKLAQVVVKKNTAVAADSADRKKTHTDTEMVTTTLDVYTAGILSQMTAEFESNDRLRTQYEISISQAMQEQFDMDCIAAAQATDAAYIYETKATGVLSWDDIAKIPKHFNQNKVPKQGRIIVVSADLEDQFWAIDVIKNAVAYNISKLENGTFLNMLGHSFFISGNVPAVGGKANVVGIYGPGLAFILNRYSVIKEVYSNTLQADIVDFLAHAAAELDDDKFGCVVKLK